MNELWEKASQGGVDKPDPAIIELLDQRWRQYAENPQSAISLEEFRRRIKAP